MLVSTPTIETCSPRTRGWTGRGGQLWLGGSVFPAHAGMDRPAAHRVGQAASVPRARGDGPRSWLTCPCASSCSPRTRGWTELRHPPRDMDARVPRARGDGPYSFAYLSQMSGVFPAHAGMDRGDRLRWQARNTCSPRTRGWTGRCRQGHAGDEVFPAHAGMDRQRRTPAWTPSRVPRARGDGPIEATTAEWSRKCSPRTRGWTVGVFALKLNHTSVPRARGDGPYSFAYLSQMSGCSPRTRGWTGLRE